MSKESISMTPPPTPTKTDVVEDIELDPMYLFNDPNTANQKKYKGLQNVCNDEYLLDCQGEMHPGSEIGKKSYLYSSLLKFLHEPNSTEVANYVQLNFSTDVLCGKFSRYILKARKAVQILERCAQPLFVREIDADDFLTSAFALRKEVVEIFHNLFQLLLISNDEDISFLQSVVFEIIDFIKFLGPIHLLPSHIIYAASALGNKNLTASYHLLHLHLDVRWWSLFLLHQVDQKYGGNGCFQSSWSSNFDLNNDIDCTSDTNSRHKFFNWLLHVIIWDILTLMKRQASKVTISELNELSSFPCSCCYELTVLVLHLVEWRHKNYDQNYTFWTLIDKRLLLLLNLKKNMLTSKDPHQHLVSSLTFPPPTFDDLKIYQIWWMFTKIAELIQHEAERDSSSDSFVKSEMMILRTLVKTTIIQCDYNVNISEEELRWYLRCCFTLQELWKNDEKDKLSHWVVSLWEYFSKLLNSSFMVKTGTLDGFTSICKTPSTLIKQIRSLTENRDCEKSESSWMIFLRIVAIAVTTSENEWRILKGRINSKFHSKKMAELTSVGLYNTSVLYLALANAKDLTLCTKLCDLLADVPQDCVEKLDVVLNSLTTTAYLLVSKNCHLECIAEKFEKIVSSLSRYYTMTIDSTKKRNIGRSFIFLCSAVQEVLEISCDLTLGQSIFFNSAMYTFCVQATVIEQGSILSCLNVVLSKVLASSRELYFLADGTGIDILESIWCNFQGFIKSQLRSEIPPSVLGSVCASLVLCSTRYQQFSKQTKINEASELTSYIIGNEIVSRRVALQFLSVLLKERDSIDYIATFGEKYDEQMIDCLLTSLVEYGSSDEVVMGAEAIFGTPKMVEILGNSPPACPFGAFEMLIQNFSKKFKSCESFQDRLKLRDKAYAYIIPLERALPSLFKKTPLPSHLSQILELVGCIFSYATSLLYVKGRSDSPIAKLISTVILPNTIYNLERSVSAVMTDALIPIIPKVIVGLSSLGPTSDSYVNRCLKDIFHNYSHRFPFTCHPFAQVLSANSTPHSKEVQRIFIETVNTNFISKRTSSLAHLQLIISLLMEFLNRYEEHWLHILIELILMPLLELLLYLEDLHTKRTATDFLKKILLLSESWNVSNAVVEHILKFTKCNIAWYTGRVFRILEVTSVMSPSIMMKCMPGIAEVIKSTEEKRGTGHDHALRKGYRTLMEKLDIKDDTSPM